MFLLADAQDQVMKDQVFVESRLSVLAQDLRRD